VNQLNPRDARFLEASNRHKTALDASCPRRGLDRLKHLEYLGPALLGTMSLKIAILLLRAFLPISNLLEVERASREQTAACPKIIIIINHLKHQAGSGNKSTMTNVLSIVSEKYPMQCERIPYQDC
jgi:hypothetical protein